MAVLDDLGSLLVSAGVGVLGSTLFLGSLPADGPVSPQDEIVALLEVPGMPSIHHHGAQQASYEQPVVQVLVRGAPFGYQAARARAQTIYETLDGRSNDVIQGTPYLWMVALQSPWFLRSDDMSRPHLVFNVRLAKGYGA